MAAADEKPSQLEPHSGTKVLVYVGVVIAVAVSLAVSVGTSLVVSLLVEILGTPPA